MALHPKPPGKKNVQEGRILREQFGFKENDFKSGGLLSDAGMKKAEKRLKSAFAKNAALSELFKKYVESLRKRMSSK